MDAVRNRVLLRYMLEHPPSSAIICHHPPSSAIIRHHPPLSDVLLLGRLRHMLDHQRSRGAHPDTPRRALRVEAHAGHLERPRSERDDLFALDGTAWPLLEELMVAEYNGHVGGGDSSAGALRPKGDPQMNQDLWRKLIDHKHRDDTDPHRRILRASADSPRVQDHG
eukprot:CAMPEP_0181253242 /NCGR_PEP_ID=MMETSP1096-20121128/47910_1 /TAXON_ID=156174 ORGANISM="Chrysochromulina ericina, Strain CCMP281" /NCGR_SAMPLE_ID=MMETSP1096 /ASSEMBLY_ACC=CAM_ASM_000453 /LENGTH=166 /DNA_ID=CAMNT_0023351087 /DNA_START=302 /DNA_END=802 /DNA_ORIENTATION=+